ncbi:MAG: hypothetical protein ABJP70_06170 [Erythrobacter sp.]
MVKLKRRFLAVAAIATALSSFSLASADQSASASVVPVAISQQSISIANGSNRSPEAARTFLAIRQKLARGDIAGAAAMTTEPQAYAAQMEAYFERKGASAAKALFGNSKSIPLRLTMSHGAYAMVIIELGNNRFSPVAAEFYKRGRNGKLKEIVSPSPSIPCALVHRFYAEKGEPDAKVSCA